LANCSLRHALCRESSGLVQVVWKVETGIPAFFPLCFFSEKTTTAFSVFCGGAISPSFFLSSVRCRICLRRPGLAGPSAADGQPTCSCGHKSRTSELVGGTHARGHAAAFRARSGSDPRGVQSANSPRLPHASCGRRELSLIWLKIGADTKSGTAVCRITAPKGTTSFELPLAARAPTLGKFQGLSQDDVMYLIMPDRFANGDPTNDEPQKRPVPRSFETRAYHGGDLLGIQNRLPI